LLLSFSNSLSIFFIGLPFHSNPRPASHISIHSAF
jgi:hypothetical protein